MKAFSHSFWAKAKVNGILGKQR